jgi:tetratricopeptide (TPR) repeat protein
MPRFLFLAAVLAITPALCLAQKAKSTPPPSASAADLFQKAKEKEAAGDIDGAIELLKTASTLPNAGLATLRYGELLETKKDLDTAMEAYQKAASGLTGGQKGEALARLSLLQDLRGIPEAKASAQAAAEADAEGAWPNAALARARAAEGKADDAFAAAEKGRGAGSAGLAAFARAQELKGDLAVAEATARQATDGEPGNLLAQVELSRILRLENKPGDALPILQKVIEGAPGATLAYIESARDKLLLGRTQEANADAQTAAAIAEGSLEAQALAKHVAVETALAHLRANEVDLAFQDLTALVAADPKNAEAHVGLAQANMAKRLLDPAASELESALSLDPKLPDAHFQKGFFLEVYKQNPAGALPELQEAVTLSPENVRYRTQLGAALLETKDFDKAVAELTKATSTPGYSRPEGFMSLGAALLGGKHYKEAIPPLTKAAELAPKNAQVEAYLAWCYFGLKDADNFKLHGGKARALGHNEPTLLAYLGRIEKGEAIK